MPNAGIEAPYHPIIYVRGYAGSEDAVEETVATPYMGFNLGSTKVRQRWDKKPERFIFESPLVRLMKDHGYRDVYEAGEELYTRSRIQPRSLVIYRYYDQVSKTWQDDPDRPDIPHHARGLSALVAQVRDAVCGTDAIAPEEFRIYLVAHSMGGLIVRCFLQNPDADPSGTKQYVDKAFTYATPHNGIDVNVIGNVPGFFSRNNVNNFNRGKMHEYLHIGPPTDRVDSLEGRFPEDRFFCLVGTNDRDYEVARGWSRRMVGGMSDGLVRIENATVRHAPRAFVHRSHSGDFGIVNSEDGYQNLERFFFGDVRIDGVLEVNSVSLPPDVDKAYRSDKPIRASYHFETIVRPRAARYDLHRRTIEQGSAILRTFDELTGTNDVEVRHPYLFSAFLGCHHRSKAGPGPLVFSVEIGVRVPEYTVDNKLRFDDHIEGSYLYRDSLTIGVTRPRGDEGWKLSWGLDSRTPGRTGRSVEPEMDGDRAVFRIPVKSSTRPGLDAELVLTARNWG